MFFRGNYKRLVLNNSICFYFNQPVWIDEPNNLHYIAPRKRGVKGGKKINGIQSAEVRRLIKDKLPDQLKLPFGLWTREAVKQLIFEKYGIELSRWQVGRYLKSWGYTPQKPISKAFEQKPEKVKEWMAKDKKRECDYLFWR